jgi:peptidoglycan/xylan/chitin deacetylase (PgdA/CDA1 family)
VSARFVLTIDAPGTLDTANYRMSVVPSAQLQNGMISVAFDDGWESTYTKALPLFNKYGIRTTQYIIADYSINHQAGYMNVAEIKQMVAAGNEIASHSIRHCDMTSLTSDNLAYDSVDSKDALNELGFNVKSFAYPYGKYSTQTQAALQNDYKLVRSSDVGYNDGYFDPMNIEIQSVENKTTNTELQSWIQHAADNKLWLVLVYHRVDEGGDYSSTAQQLESQLKLIHDSKLTVLPVSEAASKITGLQY